MRIAAAFTVAYTTTLALATLASVALDGRMVASALALTIALAGVANLLPRARAWSWLLAFACGLMHGFGFANVLAEMRVSPAALGVSLAAFNAGIEIGVLVAVCLLYPPITWLRVQPRGRRALRGVSAGVALAGLSLLIERAFLSA